jgi:hypothetical protein
VAGSLNNQAADQAFFPADSSVGGQAEGLPTEPPGASIADSLAGSHSGSRRSVAWMKPVAATLLVAGPPGRPGEPVAVPIVDSPAELVMVPIAARVENSADGPDEPAAAAPLHASPHFRSTVQRPSALPAPIQIGIDSSRLNFSLHLRLAVGALRYILHPLTRVLTSGGRCRRQNPPPNLPAAAIPSTAQSLPVCRDLPSPKCPASSTYPRLQD